MSRVAIIIPTFHEERTLPQLFRQLRQLDPPPSELIVVDGGSRDRTLPMIQAQLSLEAARPDGLSVQLVQSPVARRSYQMNLGARLATSDYLCFLHADTALPVDALQVICATLAQPETAAGGFISLMRGPLTTRWLTSFHNFIKTYYAPLLFRPLLFLRGGRLLFGDQAIFCRRQQFLDCGGYADELPIMEEADMLLRLVRYGRIRQVNRIVEASDRRVAKWGFWRANALFLYIGIRWGLGYSPEKLKRLYDDIR